MAFNPLEFTKEAYGELKKVSWLSRKEMLGSTLAVFVLVVLVALFVSAVDFVLSIFLGAVLGR